MPPSKKTDTTLERIATDRNGSRKIDVRGVCGSALENEGISAIANHRRIYEIGVFLKGE